MAAKLHAALLLLAATFAAASSSTMFVAKECEDEVFRMARFKCVFWIAGKEKFRPFGASLKGFCEEINSLSSNCRWDALSDIISDVPGYERKACLLKEKCGLTGCATCSAGGASVAAARI